MREWQHCAALFQNTSSLSMYRIIDCNRSIGRSIELRLIYFVACLALMHGRCLGSSQDASWTGGAFCTRGCTPKTSRNILMGIQEDDYVGAVATYAKLFGRCRALNVSHPQQYVCHANRAAAYLKLGLFDEALLDSERCRQLAEASFKKYAHSLTSHLSYML